MGCWEFNPGLDTHHPPQALKKLKNRYVESEQSVPVFGLVKLIVFVTQNPEYQHTTIYVLLHRLSMTRIFSSLRHCCPRSLTGGPSLMFSSAIVICNVNTPHVTVLEVKSIHICWEIAQTWMGYPLPFIRYVWLCSEDRQFVINSSWPSVFIDISSVFWAAVICSLPAKNKHKTMK